MIDLADALKAERPGFLGRPRLDAPLGEKRSAPKPAFTMERLHRVALWGATAAGAVLAVALTSRSDVAVDRFAVLLHRPRPAQAPVFDAQAATAQLANAVRVLKVNGEQLETRLAAVEHDMDVTGSIAKQIQEANASRHAEEGPSVAATALASATMAPLEPPPAAVPAAVSGPAKADPNIALPPLPKTAFGVDIGSGSNLQALRMRWASIRTAHPQFFEGLEPIISVREMPHSNRIELRLVAGPLPQPGTAAELCAKLTPLGLYCQPTIYDGQHLALR